MPSVDDNVVSVPAYVPPCVRDDGSDDNDDDAAPVAQRRTAAAARVSPPAAPAVRAQAGHNLRRTKAVSYKV